MFLGYLVVLLLASLSAAEGASWSDWSSWSTHCSQTCGKGYLTRQRSCLPVNISVCPGPGPRYEIKPCSLPRCNVCPSGFRHFYSHGRPVNPATHTYHGSCYRFERMPENWFDARRKCLSLGSDLVSIESAGEQHHLQGVIRTNPIYQKPEMTGVYNHGYWTSGTDQLREGTWKWAATGGTMSYGNWNPREPNNHAIYGEDCLHVIPGTYRWNDAHCVIYLMLYICEKRALI